MIVESLLFLLRKIPFISFRQILQLLPIQSVAGKMVTQVSTHSQDLIPQLSLCGAPSIKLSSIVLLFRGVLYYPSEFVLSEYLSWIVGYYLISWLRRPGWMRFANCGSGGSFAGSSNRVMPPWIWTAGQPTCPVNQFDSNKNDIGFKETTK